MSSSSKHTVHVISADEIIDSLGIPYEEIESATNNFSNENLLAQGSTFRVYKGQLLQSGELSNIVARKSQQTSTLINELTISQKIKHKHIVSVFKISETKDGSEGVIINKYEANGSLDKHLSDPNLTWMRRLQICVKVALALRYLHFDAQLNHHIIHGNIKSSKILLDHIWEPKFHGFGFALRAKKHLLHFTMEYKGMLRYMDPAYEYTKCLTHKSDVFSFGVLLFEVLFGREASVQSNDNWYFARLARSHYEDGTLDDLIAFNLRKQMNLQSLETFAEIAYNCLNKQRSQRPDMNQVFSKLEKALELQLKHLNKYRLEEISVATNNFANENLITEGVYLGKLYKGQLMFYRESKLMDIVVRRFDCEYAEVDHPLQMEISMLSTLKHKNIISLVGFCDEDDEKIIIYEDAVNGSLDQNLSNPNLRWFQRLQICIGVARALSYIHYDVIHCDINSSKIFLNDDWEPKIFGFELCTRYPQSWRHRLLFSRHFDNTNMTPKYDVYSFGVVLFEILCGRKTTNKDDVTKKKLEEIIDPDLRKQMDTQSLVAFIKITYSCLDQQLAQRPTMDQVVKGLEDVFELQWRHENIFLLKEHSTLTNEATSLNSLKMELLKIPLSEIRMATNNFDEGYSVGYGGYGIVYKATLDVIDIQNLPLVEGKVYMNYQREARL